MSSSAALRRSLMAEAPPPPAGCLSSEVLPSERFSEISAMFEVEDSRDERRDCYRGLKKDVYISHDSPRLGILVMVTRS